MEDFIPAKFSDAHRKQGLPVDHDCKNVVIVASAWLLFYVVMLSGLMNNHGRDLLANIEALVPR